MTPEQQKKLLLKAQILKSGGPAALAMMQLLDSFEARLGGIKGEQGEMGPAGEAGPIGPRGGDGPAGPMGPQGFDGEDGKQGPPGPQGNDGPPGPRGERGERGERGYTGKDGVLPTGEELKKMILSLDGQWFPASHIKDLPTVTRELPSLSIFGGGQGGGGARLEVLVGGVSLGQDIRKIFFTGGVTGSRNADGVITLNMTGGGGSSVSFGAEGEVPFTNATSNDFNYSSVFKFDGSTLFLTGKDLGTSGNRLAAGYFTDLNVAAAGALTFQTVGSKNISISQSTIKFNDLGNATYIGLIGASMSGGNQTITLPDATGTVILSGHTFTGDVTATLDTDGSTALTIANDAVTFAKFQNITDNRLLGRSAGSSGDMQEITVGTGLSLSSGTLTSTITQYTDEMAQDAVGAMIGSSLQYVDATPLLDTIQDIRTSASPQFTGINVGHASDTTITRSGAGDIAVEGNVVYRAGGTDVALADGGTGTSLTDPGEDRLMFWDDSAGVVKFANLADYATEAAPAAGDYLLIVAAEGDTRKVNWSSLPSGGSAHVIQDEGTPMTARANLNFVGADVTVTDDAGNNATVVTITSSSVSSFSRLFAFMGA
jgi:hypothetical protein